MGATAELAAVFELRVPLDRDFFAEPGGAVPFAGLSSLDSTATLAVVSGECDVLGRLFESLLLLCG